MKLIESKAEYILQETDIWDDAKKYLLKFK